MLSVTNVFLLRHPARVVASFAKKYPNPTVNDIGFSQQVELFKYLRDAGQKPLVLNSEDLREDPEAKLIDLCNGLGVEFESSMLSWPKGGMSFDGVWAKHWYGAVHSSSGFGNKEGALPRLATSLSNLSNEALADYEFMVKYSL
jgi:hypothetical protein